MEDFLDSKSFIEFGKRLIIFDRWFGKPFMQLRLLFRFWYGRNVPLFKLKATPRKDPSIGFVLISILKPKFLNIWMALFLSLSVSLPFKFFTTIKPSSLYNPTSFWMMSFVGCDNINIPRSSNTLAQSWLPIVTSKQNSDFFFHVLILWNSKEFLLCFIIRMSSLLMLIFVFANAMAASKVSSLIDGKSP